MTKKWKVEVGLICKNVWVDVEAEHSNSLVTKNSKCKEIYQNMHFYNSQNESAALTVMLSPLFTYGLGTSRKTLFNISTTYWTTCFIELNILHAKSRKAEMQRRGERKHLV